MQRNFDTKMRLLAGQPIYVDGIPIHPITIGEIVRVGFTEFQQHIQLLSLGLDELIESVDNFELQAMLKMNRHQYKAYDLFMMSDAMSEIVVESMKIIFQTENVKVTGEFFGEAEITIDDVYTITRDNFEEIVDVIKMQNNPSPSEDDEEEFNPRGELEKSIAEKLKRARDIVKKSKAMDKGDEGVGLDDVISAVTAMSNSINKLNVWDYTLYQLYDEFSRLVKIDSYRLQIQASMFSSDVEVEHWSEPL